MSVMHVMIDSRNKSKKKQRRRKAYPVYGCAPRCDLLTEFTTHKYRGYVLQGTSNYTALTINTPNFNYL